MATKKFGFPDTKFLIIDHNPEVLHTVERYLRMDAVRTIHMVESALLGLEILKNSEAGIDCIICAEDLAPIPGIEFLKNIRSGKYGDAPGLRGITFILLTAHREAALVRTALKLDVHGYIVKPFDLLGLTRGIRKSLEHRVSLKSASTYAAVDITRASKLPVLLIPPQATRNRRR